MTCLHIRLCSGPKLWLRRPQLCVYSCAARIQLLHMLCHLERVVLPRTAICFAAQPALLQPCAWKALNLRWHCRAVVNPGLDWAGPVTADQLLKPPVGAASVPLPLPHVHVLEGLQAHSCPADEAAGRLRSAVLSGTFCLSSLPTESDQVRAVGRATPVHMQASPRQGNGVLRG